MAIDKELLIKQLEERAKKLSSNNQNPMIFGSQAYIIDIILSEIKEGRFDKAEQTPPRIFGGCTI